ncbi:MAG: hypothetical protein KAI81_04365 [Candidatus Marinimicrobia bacterium]|nr:hypothetical protein [Candidatus Neomarinimicrobiota bacterium]
MKVYQKGFNDHINGVYVVITNDEIKIINGRYGLITLAEMYFHKIHINVNEMKIVMMNKDNEVLSVIYNAERIADLRTDEK